MEKYVNVIVTREVNGFLNSDNTPFNVNGLKAVKARALKIIKRCKKKLASKKKLDTEDFNKTQDTSQKSSLLEQSENPYQSSAPRKIHRREFSVTQDYSDNSKRIKRAHNKSVLSQSKQPLESPLPKVTSRGDNQSIYNNQAFNSSIFFSTPGVKRTKYNRSISHNRSSDFNHKLSMIFHENMQKEKQMQKAEKCKTRVFQNKYRDDLWQQVKHQKDMKKAKGDANLKMDEEYINIGRNQVTQYLKNSEEKLKKIRDLSEANRVMHRVAKQREKQALSVRY